MVRSTALLLGLVVCLLLVPMLLRSAGAQSPPLAVVDLHADLSYQLNYRARPFERGSGQYAASELSRAGLVGVVLPLYIPRDVSPTGPQERDLEWSYARVFERLARSDVYQLPGCRPRPGRVQTWLAFEGAAPLAERPELLARWVARGLRLVGLVHNYDNALATSSGKTARVRRPARGLTPEGRAVVERAHALGALIDVSHASDAATDEVLQMAVAAHVPVVATHSNARAVHRHPRNLTDAQARTLAATGGVVGVNFHSPYLTSGRRAGLEDVVRHIRHFLRLVGPDHVAIGSDFEGGIRPPVDLSSAAGFPQLAGALLRAGVAREDVERVLSKNALRLLCARPPSGRVR